MLTSLAILAILAILGFAYYKKTKKFTDIIVLPAITKRTDLLYGYYGCLDNQVAETKDHINLFMESQFMGLVNMVVNIKTAKMTTMIDVSPQVFEILPGEELRILSPNAEANLRLLLNVLRTSEALQYVKFIYRPRLPA